MNTSAITQVVTEELRQWIVAQAQAGCMPEDVVKAMVASGWHEDVAVEALEQTLREHLQALQAGTGVSPPLRPAPRRPRLRFPSPTCKRAPP